MQYLGEYLLFLFEAATVVIAIIIVVASLVAVGQKAKGKDEGKITAKKLNDHYQAMKETINEVSLNKSELKIIQKELKLLKKTSKRQPRSKRFFILNFHGDIRGSAVKALRHEIDAILLSANQEDEVLVCVESGGGLVNSYGLAAAQLARLRAAQLKLTVAIDKIAASGGYLMACVADQIIAAPFAIVGSIGVIAQLPNFHRLLEKHHIDFEQLTAGEYKRTLTLFGKNTTEGRKKLQEEIDETHLLFKRFIERYRPSVAIDQVATGEHWFAEQAIDLNLVDNLQTSDEFLLAHHEQFDLIKLKYHSKKKLGKQLSESMHSLLHALGIRERTTGSDYI